MHPLFSLLQICLITSWQHKSVVLVGTHTQYPTHPESCFLGKRNSANLYSFSFQMFGLNQSIKTFGTRQYNWETHSVSSTKNWLFKTHYHWLFRAPNSICFFSYSTTSWNQSPWPSLPANLICWTGGEHAFSKQAHAVFLFLHKFFCLWRRLMSLSSPPHIWCFLFFFGL